MNDERCSKCYWYGNNLLDFENNPVDSHCKNLIAKTKITNGVPICNLYLQRYADESKKIIFSRWDIMDLD